MKRLLLLLISFISIAWTPTTDKMFILGHSCTGAYQDYFSKLKSPITGNYFTVSRGAIWGSCIEDWLRDGTVTCEDGAGRTGPGTAHDCSLYNKLSDQTPEWVVLNIEFNDYLYAYHPEHENGDIYQIIVLYKQLVNKIQTDCPTCKIVIMTTMFSDPAWYGAITDTPGGCASSVPGCETTSFSFYPGRCVPDADEVWFYAGKYFSAGVAGIIKDDVLTKAGGGVSMKVDSIEDTFAKINAWDSSPLSDTRLLGAQGIIHVTEKTGSFGTGDVINVTRGGQTVNNIAYAWNPTLECACYCGIKRNTNMYFQSHYLKELATQYGLYFYDLQAAMLDKYTPTLAGLQEEYLQLSDHMHIRGFNDNATPLGEPFFDEFIKDGMQAELNKPLILFNGNLTIGAVNVGR